jgi:cytidine deaminase
MKQSFTFNYQLFSNWTDLPEQEQRLVDKAYEAMENAYAPYSEFKVGACALMDDGSFILGNNQENAAFPSGICAERVALFYAGANFPNKKVSISFFLFHKVHPICFNLLSTKICG